MAQNEGTQPEKWADYTEQNWVDESPSEEPPEPEPGLDDCRNMITSVFLVKVTS